MNQLVGAAGPGGLRILAPPILRVFGRGLGGGVSGISRRFLIEGWTVLGVTVTGFARPSSGDAGEPPARRSRPIRSLTEEPALEGLPLLGRDEAKE